MGNQPSPGEATWREPRPWPRPSSGHRSGSFSRSHHPSRCPSSFRLERTSWLQRKLALSWPLASNLPSFHGKYLEEAEQKSQSWG